MLTEMIRSHIVGYYKWNAGQQCSLQQLNIHGWLISRNDQTSNIHIHEVCHATDGAHGANLVGYQDSEEGVDYCGCYAVKVSKIFQHDHLN